MPVVFGMSLSVFLNGFIQTADVLPEKTARTENDEASLSKRRPELFCILPADASDVVDRCIRSGWLASTAGNFALRSAATLGISK